MPKRKPFALRISPSIHEAMQRWADDELRSLNGQIEYVLREALRSTGRLEAPPIDPLEDEEPGSDP